MDSKHLSDEKLIVVAPLTRLKILTPINKIVKGFDGITFVDYDISKIHCADVSSLLKITDLINKKTNWIILAEISTFLYQCGHKFKASEKQSSDKSDEFISFYKQPGEESNSLIKEKLKIILDFVANLRKEIKNVLVYYSCVTKKYTFFDDFNRLKKMNDYDIGIKTDLNSWCQYINIIKTAINGISKEHKEISAVKWSASDFFKEDRTVHLFYADFFDVVKSSMDSLQKVCRLSEDCFADARKTVENLQEILKLYINLKSSEKVNYILEMREKLLSIQNEYDIYMSLPEYAPYYTTLHDQFSNLKPPRDEKVFKELFLLYSINHRDKRLTDMQNELLTKEQMDILKNRQSQEKKLEEHKRFFNVAELEKKFEFLHSFDRSIKRAKIANSSLNSRIHYLIKDLDRAGAISFGYMETLTKYKRLMRELIDYSKKNDEDCKLLRKSDIQNVLKYCEALEKCKSGLIPIAEATRNKPASYKKQFIDHCNLKDKRTADVFIAVEFCHYIMNLKTNVFKSE